MPDTGNAKYTIFSIFILKNVNWRTYLISFRVQYWFLFRFVCIELVWLIWFLQIWVAIYVYGTMINWSTLIKKLMQTYIVIVSGSILNISTVHLNGIWHLIWRYPSKPVFGGHPVLSGHYSIPWRLSSSCRFHCILEPRVFFSLNYSSWEELRQVIIAMLFSFFKLLFLAINSSTWINYKTSSVSRAGPPPRKGAISQGLKKIGLNVLLLFCKRLDVRVAWVTT